MARKKDNVESLDDSSNYNHKIMSMEEEKRNRLIQVAMQEFTKGYSLANTDEITRNAGISKGLLFHYFGSKKGLFLFLTRYAIQTVRREYLKVTFDSQDFLTNIWKVSLVARQLSFQYPVLYRFLGKAAFSFTEVFPEGVPGDLSGGFEEMMRQIYQNADRSLFRSDIDVDKACNIVIWTVKGYSDTLLAYGSELDNYQAHYDEIEQELEEYLQILRRILYR
ncbi:MAG: TetR/AcrR family transcriptional regulator [Caldilineaceae bacterium]|nr:TetR/AcrR family transcriptional regulator [Caldilineaceae bacterium]